MYQVQRDLKIDKLSQDAYTEQAVEILTALKKLGDVLRPEEEAFLQSHASDSLKQFEKVTASELGRL
jgi:Beta-catenin-interacting protein ICAT